jgi:hypothetical protein
VEPAGPALEQAYERLLAPDRQVVGAAGRPQL